MGRINRRLSGWRRERRQGITACIPSLPGCWLAVAFSTKVPRAIASATALSGFRVLALSLQAQGWSRLFCSCSTWDVFPHTLLASFKCTFAFDRPFIKLSSGAPIWVCHSCRTLVGTSDETSYLEIRRPGLPWGLSQVPCVSLGKVLLLSGLSFFLCEVRMMVRSSFS